MGKVEEDYMSPMDSAHQLKDTYSVMSTLDSRFGRTTEQALMKIYQQSWIAEQDIADIAAAGYNLVRIPVWWGQFFNLDNPTPSGWRSDAFEMLDAVVQNCEKYGVYVVIDMHGAIGGQSSNPDTGWAGQNTFWGDTTAQANTAWMWSQIAGHYRGNTTVAGYDLMNEPAPPSTYPLKQTVWAAYDQLYRSVRAADPDHVIFLEDTFGAWNWDMLPAPTVYGWTNVVYETHEYTWPVNGQTASQTAAAVVSGTQHMVQDYQNHASWNVPGYIGEFNDFNTGSSTWQSSIQAYNAAGLSWTMWSFKAVNGVAPNPWGFYDPWRWPARPNPAVDSASNIGLEWQNWTTALTFAVNTALGSSSP